ncbi:MAG TPA: hypothetical protein VG293_05780 [Solirubrobacteraceae bacterium]|nr:hypothetical protein [Solirubrobacteraceae bacterium]
MSTSSVGVRGGLTASTRWSRLRSSLRAQFFSDSARTAETVLGLIWLLDAGLQFQSFMYSKGFVAMLTAMDASQPHWLGASVNWAAHAAGGNPSLYNTLFALLQSALGFGLLYRPTVRVALIGTVAWSLIVWWFGESFGMLFMNGAEPLTGAPGAAVIYALVGLVIWPGRPGGLLGIRGTRIMWAGLWLLSAYLWLLQSSAAANATRDMINAAPSGMSWLSSMQDGFASAAGGDGLIIALVLAALSAAIAIGVGGNRHARALLLISIVLQLLYWLVGQGFGGIFQGGATDPNAAPLFILLACTLMPLSRYQLTAEPATEATT